MTNTFPSRDTLRAALQAYEAVIDRQGVTRLPGLDRWYRLELPGQIVARRPARVTHAELVLITEWKMARGVWRAPNLVLVRSNDSDAVEAASAEALAATPHPTAPIAALTRLKGVGPATASAVVAAVSPEVYPFFDEQVAACVPGLGKVAWTTRFYERYAEALREAAARLGDDWTPARLERALWAHVGGKAGATAAP